MTLFLERAVVGLCRLLPPTRDTGDIIDDASE